MTAESTTTASFGDSLELHLFSEFSVFHRSRNFALILASGRFPLSLWAGEGFRLSCISNPLSPSDPPPARFKVKPLLIFYHRFHNFTSSSIEHSCRRFRPLRSGLSSLETTLIPSFNLIDGNLISTVALKPRFFVVFAGTGDLAHILYCLGETHGAGYWGSGAVICAPVAKFFGESSYLEFGFPRSAFPFRSRLLLVGVIKY